MWYRFIHAIVNTIVATSSLIQLTRASEQDRLVRRFGQLDNQPARDVQEGERR